MQFIVGHFFKRVLQMSNILVLYSTSKNSFEYVQVIPYRTYYELRTYDYTLPLRAPNMGSAVWWMSLFQHTDYDKCIRIGTGRSFHQ